MVYAELLENEFHNRLAFVEQSLQQMLRLNGLVAVLLSGLYSLLYDLLRFDCKVVKIHNVYIYLVYT